MKKSLIALGAALCLHHHASAADTLKVGLLAIDKGVFAPVDEYYHVAAKLAVETLNAQGGILGKQVELVRLTHAGTPATALAAATRLAQQEKVSVMTGFNNSAMAQAIAPRLSSLNAVLIDASTLNDELINTACYSHYFRVTAPDSQAVNMLGQAVRESDLKTWSFIASESAQGRNLEKAFKAMVEKAGGTVSKSMLVPYNTADFGSYITQLATNPTEGLMIGVQSGDAITLSKQQKQFGLFEKFRKVLSTYGFTNDMALRFQGDATVGVTFAGDYLPGVPYGAKNDAFVKLYKESIGREPNYLEANTWVSFELIKAAAELAGKTDANALRDALAKLKTNTIYGEVSMRPDHQLLRPTVVAKIEAQPNGGAKATLIRSEGGKGMAPPVTNNCN